MKKTNIKRLTLLSLLITIEILLSTIPALGFIPLGFINATTLHIPVIICGIILGKKEGALLGFIFGLLSLIKHTLEPGLSSFAFSPFVSIGEVHGNLYSLIIVFVPRILIGFSSGLVYETLINKLENETVVIVISAISGSLLNTFLVLTGILVFFGEAYAAVIGIAYSGLIIFILGIIVTSGIIEAVIAALFTLPIYKASKRFMLFEKKGYNL